MRKNHIQLIDRAAYSPSEFAAFFGKHPTWSYRLLYAGKVHALTTLGRILIPASELERVLEPLAEYNPKPKTIKAKSIAEISEETNL